MTDQAASSNSSAVGFGYAEIAYLLKRISSPEAVMSASVLRLTEEMESDSIPVAGASSLLARGFAEITDVELEVADAALPVAYALGRATLWTEISLMQGDVTDTVVHVESDPVCLLMQPRTLMTWFVFAQDPDVSGPDAEVEIIEEHVRQHPRGTAMLRTRVDGADAVLLIRPDGLSWAVGTIEAGAEDVVERTGLTVAELRDAVASLRLNLKASA
ncbi:hypothetical protein [Agreia sp. COWG]|uniref:hypothetical protein n=1 Tax=Agreia sp. COWG TaxID=2773266 RepID=UPI001925FDFB|nr:hypothetical protein [Agreia sp. COWG]CAD6006660.1 conserved protein of unknown function [Agreia sp. COWG]